MSDRFALLFSSLLDSTIWVGQPHHVVRVWIAMLLMKDERGLVSVPVPGLARRACVTIQETEEALAILGSPDPYSRSPEHEGRRIEAVRGGWLVLNHASYRSKQFLEQERERKREDARRRRSDQSTSTATDRYAPLHPATGSHGGEEEATDRYLSISSSSSGSSESGEGVQREPDPAPESAPEATEIRFVKAPSPERRAAKFVPDSWQPNESHRVRCQELRFDLAALVSDFRRQEFNREYSDWDRRFSKWIEDERIKRQTANASARASPRAAASPPPPPKGKPAAQGIAEWQAEEAELARQADIEMGRVPRRGTR